ncbi:N,N-dimethylformamidase beta subunit family domain-containing protein [Hwanghaeella sp.]|uniref:N,N-dimethylformamidase beta subunit family domain-containing protein n=1 Tax=Hwanghaeella sp. TaxID=2605943 RepID=UPI003CCBB1C2
MTYQLPRIPIIGYCDPLSVRPGGTVSFKVSASGQGAFTARLMRSICADPNPAGPGIVEEAVEASINGDYPARQQGFNPGSYALIPKGPAIPDDVTFTAKVWPTLPGDGEQVIMSLSGVELFLDESGALAGRAGETVVSTGRKLSPRKWYSVRLSYHCASGTLTVEESPKDIWGEPALATGNADGFTPHLGGPMLVAAGLRDGQAGRHFDGKIEAPTVFAADSAEARKLAARWDFARSTSSIGIKDVGPHGLHGRLVNHPARAMTGYDWDGSEMNWQHKPEHYGAIHFHRDDIYDFGWETDVEWTVPDDLPSGIYVLRIAQDGHEDAIPFFVCPPKGKRTADLCVLVSTFTYTIYGNHSRPDFKPEWKEKFDRWNGYPWNPAEYEELGCSTYNFHKDGSGICHCSHLRPLLNTRPGYITMGYGDSSGLRHFQADSHLIWWLHEKGIPFDIVTDRELHEEGAEALTGYKAVTTGSHPEYHTPETLDALLGYRNNGGKFLYLGGNGFYWRVAVHPEEKGIIEIRRAEGGIRAWAAEPGEYFMAFNGGYGGLWRRNGRPPQHLAGVGFTSQGQFEGTYYRRTEESREPDLAWIFDGVEDDVLGDFGFSGGGAAGYELDRADVRLGSPENVRILAVSENHPASFVLVPEELLTHLTTWAMQPIDELIRADMIYFDVPGGGAVFSVGSITFCGSLPWNGGNNNISRIVENVIRRFTA